MHWLLQFLTLYGGLWEVLRDESQFDAIPLSIGLLCIALKINMALQHLDCCYYASKKLVPSVFIDANYLSILQTSI